MIRPQPYRKGTVITEAGLYSGVPMAAYHGSKLCDGPSVSSSGLRTIFTESPAHYWANSPYNDRRGEPKESEALVLGRAAHHLLLSEDDFSTLFVTRPPKWDSWRSNDAKDWKRAQEIEGRTVLLPSQIAQIRGMAQSLAKHPLIEAGILNGGIEQTLVWRDAETGVWLKARPDAIPNDSGDFADLKTTAAVGFDLDRSIGTYRYDIQAALVKWAAKEVLGVEMESFSFVFVEKTVPHSVDVLTLPAEDIEAAELDLRVALRTFARCFATSHWFGPAGTQYDARYVHISDWVRTAAQNRRSFLESEIAEQQIAAE